jgi:hypothetical protein
MPDSANKSSGVMVVDPNRITLRLTVVVSVGFALWTVGNSWVNLTRDVKANADDIESIQSGLREAIDVFDERVEELEDDAQARELDMVRIQEKLTNRTPPMSFSSFSAIGDRAEEEAPEPAP